MGRFNNLPEEIMSEILSRLPTESVLDCKLVCKSWRNVFLHQSFSQMHLNHLDSAGKLTFIFFMTTLDEQFSYIEFDENFHETLFRRKTRMNLSPPFYKYHYYLVGSCNGLVSLSAWFNGYFGPAYICNPITREYILLPIAKGAYHWSGFGYVPSTNEYKVVGIFDGSVDLDAGNVQVYTLGSGNGWRSVGSIHIDSNYVTPCAGASANGAFHWVNRHEGTIVAFQLTDEKFIELPSLPCLIRSGVSDVAVTLRALGDFLSATYYPNAGSCEIWLLNKDNCDDLSWSKDFSFEVFAKDDTWPFYYTKCGRLLCYGDNNIYSYHPKDSSAKMDVSFNKFIQKGIPHKNTLVSLKVLGEKDIKTMESSERASSSEQTENKLKKPQNEVRDL